MCFVSCLEILLPYKCFINRSEMELYRPGTSLCFALLQRKSTDIQPLKVAAVMSLRFLVSARVASDPRVAAFEFFYYFILFAMKRCPIAAKIAGSIGMLLCCV